MSKASFSQAFSSIFSGPSFIRLFICFVLLFQWRNAYSQKYPQKYFNSPLSIPLSLAGNFGELRLNHFHYGLDFRTNGKEGYPVLASADGYISRVKVTGYGYGTVVYIDHPNGFTTVYGHLRKLEGPVADFVRKAQYASKRFEFEYYPKPGEFPVKQGDVIGSSGNSGGSSGPHLHFEIRETISEKPLNPLLFSLPVNDRFAPVLESVSAFSFGTTAASNKRKDYPVKQKVIRDTIVINGIGGIGFTGYDKEHEAGSRNGIYEAILMIDQDTIYHSRFDRFSFEEARYINTHLDYKLKKRNGRNIEKTFLAPNNKAPIYLKSKNSGILNLPDTLVHQGKLIFKDAASNQTTYIFPVRMSRRNKVVSAPIAGKLFEFNKTNIHSKDELQVSIPAYTLYENLDFTVKRSSPFKGAYSSVYTISSDDIPLQAAYIMTIKPSNYPEKLKDKLTIVSLDTKGRMKNAGGEWVNDGLMTESKTFGTYAVYLDTIAPFARHVGFKRGARLTHPGTIRVRAYDNLGDVSKYNGYIDGEWKPFEFDAKSDHFTYFFDEKPDGKKHLLTFECEDERGNKTAINVPYIR